MKNDRNLRITVDQAVCVGAGLCVLSSSDVFDQREEDGVVVLLQANPPPELHEKVLGAERKCPSRAIKVFMETGTGIDSVDAGSRSVAKDPVP